LIELVKGNRFDVVGCSVSADRHLKQLGHQISEIRKHSINPEVKILVGGRMFNEHPELCLAVGADASAVDGIEAVKLAESMVNHAK
jgi:methanogenic corrinoid protein MtbC1